MWLGESERIVRELFAKARARRKEGALPFIFIDEAESVLGTRRSMRSFNINNTLVPMFCAEMDGIESLRDVVIILASNRPDLIDPAVLRPGRIDRKIKVARPNREAALEILGVYLTAALPLDSELLDRNGQDHEAARRAVIEQVVDSLFSRTDQNRVLSIRLRNGHNKVLYRSDLVSGAILSSIVQRAKEKAIERAVAQAGAPSDDGIRAQDLLDAVHEEYREGEMLPPDDAAEEWLKLLDHHPDQITFHLMKRKGAMRIDLGEVILFLVLLQPRHAEPARILMRVLASIVPPTFEIAGQMGPYQLHRFFDRIDHLEIFSRDPVFRFYTEQMHSCFIHCRAKDLFPDSRFL